jgi:TAG lipase/steryl ester hydrolase/phospholipase A2/LPA acyltransferase
MPAALAVARQAYRTCRTRSMLSDRPVLPGRTALLLSGGGNLSFFHLGVIRVLLEAGLLPRVLSGASAGSLIAAIVGTRSEEDLAAIHVDELEFVGYSDRTPNAIYTAEQFEVDLARIIPDVTFAEALELSGRAVSISLAAPNGGGVICGPRSTPDVLIRDAIRASCAVPFVFEPVVVRERRRGQIVPFGSGQGWVDGSLYADVPTDYIKREYGVSHALVSLVNPAVRPFFGDGEGRLGRAGCLLMAAARGTALGCARIGRFSAAGMPRARGLFDLLSRVIGQTYQGDLVLTPSRRVVLSGVLDHPSPEMIRTLSADGAVRTRKRLEDIRSLVTGPTSLRGRGSPLPGGRVLRPASAVA